MAEARGRKWDKEGVRLAAGQGNPFPAFAEEIREKYRDLVDVNAELVAVLKEALAATLYQYRLFVGPDDAIANATIKKAKEALAAAWQWSGE